MNKAPVFGFEGFYEVSDCGRVFSLPRKTLRKDGKSFYTTKYKELSQKITKSGYRQVHLRANGEEKSMLVHRLVMLSFGEMPEKKEFVNHIDGNTGNNNIKNLEWCDKSENAIHAYRVLKVKPAMLGIVGRLHWKSKKVIATNKLTNEEIIFYALMDAQRAGFKASEIWACCNGYQKTHYGMKWRYA